MTTTFSLSGARAFADAIRRTARARRDHRIDPLELHEARMAESRITAGLSLR